MGSKMYTVERLSRNHTNLAPNRLETCLNFKPHGQSPLRNMLIVALNAVKDSRVMFYFEIS